MKCANCNQKLHKDSPICPNCSFDMSDYLQQAANAPGLSRGKKILISLALVATILCGAGAALVASGILTPAKVTVAAALLSTSSQLQQESANLKESLPLITHLEQVSQGQSLLHVTADNEIMPISANLTMDMKNTQFTLTGSTQAETLVAATGYLSSQAAIVHLESADIAIGLDLNTLVEDLSTSSFVDSFDIDAISSGYRTDILQNITQLDDELLLIFSHAMSFFSTDFDVDKLGTDTLTINDQTISTTAYSISTDPDTLRQAATSVVDGICTSTVYSPYLALLAHERGTTPAELHASLSTGINYLLDDILSIDDCTFVLHLYEGRIVLLSAQTQEGGYGISLNPTGALLDYMALVQLDGSDIYPLSSASLTMENSAFQAVFDLLGAQLSLYYFTADTSNNLLINLGEDTLVSASVDTTEEDSLSFTLPYSIGQLSLQSTLTTLDSDWFAPPSYSNLLTMSPTDLLLLAMALPF